MANDIQADVQCDFCGKWNNEVHVMVVGVRANICCECVLLASRCVIERMSGDKEYESWGSVL